MNDHLYTLQALLYLAVTDRYLTHRIDGYQKDTHLAGAAYLFLRGMIGQDTPHENGYCYGVATITPEPDVLDAVNQVLAAKFQP
jgi:exodeoxyribonuclease V beta subunit